MLHPMLTILMAVILCLLIHLAGGILAAGILGIAIREVSIGVGPTIFRLGRVRLAPIPLGGSIRFWTLDDDLRIAGPNALEEASLPARIVLFLAACLLLLLVATAILGTDALVQFTAAFSQIILGALSPLNAAQAYLAQAHKFINSSSMAAVLAVAAAKVAAMNLLPLPSLNGGQIIAMCARPLKLARLLPESVMKVLLLAPLCLYASWAFALVVYWRS